MRRFSIRGIGRDIRSWNRLRPNGLRRKPGRHRPAIPGLCGSRRKWRRCTPGSCTKFSWLAVQRGRTRRDRRHWRSALQREVTVRRGLLPPQAGLTGRSGAGRRARLLTNLKAPVAEEKRPGADWAQCAAPNRGARRRPREGAAPPQRKNPAIAGPLLMRLNGVEPSRVFPPTRPSTLRVYQFRHSRSRGGDSRCSACAAGSRLSCKHPHEALACEQVFERQPLERAPTRGSAEEERTWTWT